MKILLIYFVVIFLILAGCSPGDKTAAKGDKKAVKTLEIDIDKSQCLKYSEWFYEPVFIPLETNNYSLFTSPLQTVVTDSNIFIIPKNPVFSVLIFNKKGKFLNNIYKEGRGPEEYIAFYYIEVKEKEKIISFFDIGNRSFVWMNYKGDFIRKLKVNDFYTNIFVEDPGTGNFIVEVSEVPLYRNREFFHLLIFDPEKKDFKTYLPRKMRGNLMSENSFYKYNNVVYYNPPEWDTIFQVKNDSVIPVYYLDFKDHKKPEEIFLTDDPVKYKELKKEGMIWFHYDFKETDNYIYTMHRGIGAKRWYFHIYFKKSGKSFVFNRLINDYLGETREREMGFPDFPVALYKETIVMLHEPSGILRNYQEMKINLPEEAFRKYMDKNPGYARLVNTVKEQDNPVLGFYKVRDR